MTPEFSRPERIDTIGGDARPVSIEATPEERAAVARRFDLVTLDRLAADLSVRRTASGVMVEGRVAADATQACAITGDPLPVTIEEAVALRFVDAQASEEEIELDADGLDTVEIEDGAVDLGELAAETLALALDPFPRGPNAEAALRAAGVIREEDVRPANAFSGLKDKLSGR